MPSFSALYIESPCRDLPRVQKIRQQCAELPEVACARYGEVFNPVAQNFRLQKKRPALILAQKHQGFVLPTPQDYGFGKENSYYFSHLLNCPYDCRYCFLQGMYRSAHYVLFVNYEDFEREIEETIRACGNAPSTFYAGYDSDSLALESYSGFAEYFIPVFQRHPQACLELRTKSAQIQSLLNQEVSDNIVIAMSFSPDNVGQALEHRVPSFAKRIAAAQKLQARGWRIALRFEPLIYHQDYAQHYEGLFKKISGALDVERLHSVSLGAFRMPQSYFKNIVKRYPEEALFADEYTVENGLTAYPKKIEDEMFSNCEMALRRDFPEANYYRCGKEREACL